MLPFVDGLAASYLATRDVAALAACCTTVLQLHPTWVQLDRLLLEEAAQVRAGQDLLEEIECDEDRRQLEHEALGRDIERWLANGDIGYGFMENPPRDSRRHRWRSPSW